MCSVCQDRGYRYRGPIKEACGNLDCQDRARWLAWVTGGHEERQRVARVRARLALQAARGDWAQGVAVRAALAAGISRQDIRKATGLSLAAIDHHHGGQTSAG